MSTKGNLDESLGLRKAWVPATRYYIVNYVCVLCSLLPITGDTSRVTLQCQGSGSTGQAERPKRRLTNPSVVSGMKRSDVLKKVPYDFLSFLLYTLVCKHSVVTIVAAGCYLTMVK